MWKRDPDQSIEMSETANFRKRVEVFRRNEKRYYSRRGFFEKKNEVEGCGRGGGDDVYDFLRFRISIRRYSGAVE